MRCSGRIKRVLTVHRSRDGQGTGKFITPVESSIIGITGIRLFSIGHGFRRGVDGDLGLLNFECSGLIAQAVIRSDIIAVGIVNHDRFHGDRMGSRIAGSPQIDLVYTVTAFQPINGIFCCTLNITVVSHRGRSDGDYRTPGADCEVAGCEHHFIVPAAIPVVYFVTVNRIIPDVFTRFAADVDGVGSVKFAGQNGVTQGWIAAAIAFPRIVRSNLNRGPADVCRCRKMIRCKMIIPAVGSGDCKIAECNRLIRSRMAIRKFPGPGQRYLISGQQSIESIPGHLCGFTAVVTPIGCIHAPDRQFRFVDRQHSGMENQIVIPAGIKSPLADGISPGIQFAGRTGTSINDGKFSGKCIVSEKKPIMCQEVIFAVSCRRISCIHNDIRGFHRDVISIAKERYCIVAGYLLTIVPNLHISCRDAVNSCILYSFHRQTGDDIACLQPIRGIRSRKLLGSVIGELHIVDGNRQNFAGNRQSSGSKAFHGVIVSAVPIVYGILINSIFPDIFSFVTAIYAGNFVSGLQPDSCFHRKSRIRTSIALRRIIEHDAESGLLDRCSRGKFHFRLENIIAGIGSGQDKILYTGDLSAAGMFRAKRGRSTQMQRICIGDRVVETPAFKGCRRSPVVDFVRHLDRCNLNHRLHNVQRPFVEMNVVVVTHINAAFVDDIETPYRDRVIANCVIAAPALVGIIRIDGKIPREAVADSQRIAGVRQRVGRPIGMAENITGGNRQITLGDGVISSGEMDVVVRVRQRPLHNRIFADVFSNRTGQRTGERIVSDQTVNLVGQFRIRAAVDLRLRIRCYRDHCLIDGKYSTTKRNCVKIGYIISRSIPDYHSGYGDSIPITRIVFSTITERIAINIMTLMQCPGTNRYSG